MAKPKLTLRQLKAALDELPEESLDMDALIYQQDRNLITEITATVLMGELTTTPELYMNYADEQPLLIV